MYPHLKMEAVADLFGPELPTYLDTIYTETADFRESAGDLQVTEAAKGLRTLQEIQQDNKEHLHSIVAEIRAWTPQILANRQALIHNSTYTPYSNTATVDRTVLFKK